MRLKMQSEIRAIPNAGDIAGLRIAIPLSKGYSAVVDGVDADLDEYLWYADIRHDGRQIYGSRTPYDIQHKRQSHQRLHQMIAERMLGRKLARHEDVDHIDRNGLNNCRANLRICTHTQNMRNSGMHIDNSSGYKGADRHRKRWSGRIRVDGKNLYLGTFDTPEEAHEAYCEAAREYFGEFARFR